MAPSLVYSPRAVRRALLLTLGLSLSCCAAVPPPRPASFPPAPTWKTLLSDFVVPPLASAGHRVFVASRDGVVRALDERTGEVLWKADDLPGTLSATDGAVLVRSAQGRVTSLQPRTGAVRWSAETGVAGELPVVLDGERVLVAGSGLAALELASGKAVFTSRAGALISGAPVPLSFRAAPAILTVEADGALRLRDGASGEPLWVLSTARPLIAPPLVDARRGVAYLGTTEKRILEVSLADGHVGWRWTVGADVAQPGLQLKGKLLFACFDAVLYALGRNGNLAWRASLPSRPLSGPLVVGEYLLVACIEDELVLVSPKDGKRVGVQHVGAEIRTAPILIGNLVVLGLRDRSVVAYGPPAVVEPKHAGPGKHAASGAAPEGHEDAAPASPVAPASPTTTTPAAPVVPAGGDR